MGPGYSLIVLEHVAPEVFHALSDRDKSDPDTSWWVNDEGEVCISDGIETLTWIDEAFWVAEPVIIDVDEDDESVTLQSAV